MKSLGKVGKGASILFIGTIVGLIFHFLARVLIARFYSPDHYGIYNLFYTLLTIFVTISALGLRSGIYRYIGYYEGKEKGEKIKEIEKWGILISILSGTAFGILLFFLAPIIAPIFSERTEFVFYLRIAGFTLPFYVLLRSLISVFRGHESSKEKVFFYELGRNGVFLLIAFIIGIFALPFVGIIWAMFLATASMAISIFIYYLRKLRESSPLSLSLNPSTGKTLLTFSLPLLFVGLMYNVMGWSDTMLIGYFLYDDSVGFYNVAKPLSSFIAKGLSIATFIYAPLVSGLYAKNKFKENQEIYSSLTKWICFLSLPFAMVFFIFPESIIYTLFGEDYSAAIIPLQILVFTYFFEVFNGPNGPTLTAYGKTKFLMLATAVSALTNIVLNIVLIPIYGIIGAAIATGLTIILVNIIRTFKVYRVSEVHSFKSNNIYPVITTVIIGVLMSYPLKYLPIPRMLQAIIFFISLYLLFLTTMLITKSFSRHDLKVLMMIEKKIGIDLSFLKKIFRKLS